MAIANTRKDFNFRIEILGIDQMECQKVTLPEVEIESVAHGGANLDIKTPGRVKVGDLTIEKVKPMDGSDTWAWDWLVSAQHPALGGGAPIAAVKRMVVVKELAEDGITTLNRWVYLGCWVKKVSQSPLDRMGSNNTMQTVVISVDIPDNTA